MSNKQFPISHDIVTQSLKALVRANPNLALLEHDKVVFLQSSAKESSNKKKVSLVSGGGSGHEPTHAGFVGTGLLDAAVAGSVFASPSTKQIFAGLQAVASPEGTLVVVKNYTGDVIHFGLAAERFRAKTHGKVEVVVVGDDVSVGREKGGMVGRRGLAATCLVHKIAGAAAQAGHDLASVAAIARGVASNSVTIASSLDHCNVPGRPFETNLNAEEIEIGMGIHNEAGVKKVSPIPSVPNLLKSILPMLVDQADKDRAFVDFAKSDDVILVVNNLGGLSNLELGYITDVVVEQLGENFNITPKRVAFGAFITALNGAGFSVTLLNATKASSKANGADIVELFDAPANAPGWNAATFTTAEAKKIADSGKLNAVQPPAEGPLTSSNSGLKIDASQFKTLVAAALEQVKKEEPKITKYDTVAGDGDCGETLVSGANAITAAFEGKYSSELRLDDAVDTFLDLGEIVEDSMGGTSGGLYSIYLNALAQGLKENASGSSTVSSALFAKAAPFALEQLYKYTGARVGDRTLIDALTPFVETLSETKGDFAKAVKAAQDGADSTRKLAAKFGRASYVSEEEFKQFDSEGGLPDPGAVGLAALLTGALSAYK